MRNPSAASQYPEANAAATSGGGSFVELDALVRRAGACGVIQVAVEKGAGAALARHLGRRCRQLGRPSILAAGSVVAEPWHQLAAGCAVETTGRHPLEAATEVAGRLVGAVAIVEEEGQGSWAAAFVGELMRRASEPELGFLLVILRREGEGRARDCVGRVALPSSSPVDEQGPLQCQLAVGAMSHEDRASWWDAVLAEDTFFDQGGMSELGALDGWWQGARLRPAAETSSPPRCDQDAQRAARLLFEARQAFSRGQVRALDAETGCQKLLASGIATVDASGAVALLEAAAAAFELSEDDSGRLIDVLGTIDVTPWSLIRAGELCARQGSVQAAEERAFEALQLAGEPAIRDGLWRRWEGMLGRLRSAEDTQGQLRRYLRSSELALRLGDADRALQAARQAMTMDGNDHAVLLIHGRASQACGDLASAALSLTRAMAGSRNHAGQRAEAAALLAQVRYLAGDLAQAESFARSSVEQADSVETRLEARNVLGKLLLTREAWAEAEQHFATDGYDAAVVGHREFELRARLNRAIAVLCLGRREQARGMLEEVMEEGERHGVLHAVTYTLSNLATIATLDHRYPEALGLSERAIEVARQLGERSGLVQQITNVAELRLRLGLVDEAEQGLRFGLQAFGKRLPAARYAYFAKVAACIHLVRGDTLKAAREVAAAISGAEVAGDQAVLAQCHRIRARIALEDGDVPAAEAALERARELQHTAFGRAELALLKALVARAAGRQFLAEAQQALVLAQQADDLESLREAHLLSAIAYRMTDDEGLAARHLKGAIQARDQIVASLPTALRARFLGRADLMALAAFESSSKDVVLAPAAPEVVAVAPVPKKARERGLVGDSPVMRALRSTISRVAASNTTVLISGPTGTGKELVAEALHRESARSKGPLVKVNCAALVETLLLSELFGHEKGAFTGAGTRRRGRFELADGGTLFLDEIGDISPRTQVALLRVLQDGTFERVGGSTPLKAKVRIVCATHRNLKELVQRGEFREDLYYRLCGVVIEVPALRERTADLPDLAVALLEDARVNSGINPKPLSEAAIRGLSCHGWPGNVRELENAVRVAALFASGDEIELSDFSENVDGLSYLEDLPPHSRPGASIPGARPSEIPPGEESIVLGASSSELAYEEIRGGLRLADLKRKLEQECITRALVDSGGNITRAANLLGMKRPRLSQLVKQYKLASVLEELKS